MGFIDKVADRMAAAVLRSDVAQAGCTYEWYACYCKGGLRYRKKCMYNCPGVPNHCYGCDVTGTC